MGRATIIAQAVGAAGVLVAWTLTEVLVARTYASERGELVGLLAAWAISYFAGFRAGQKLVSAPERWRIPFLVSAALIALAPGLGRLGPLGGLAGYVLASAALGLYTAASTSVVFNALSSDSWREALSRLRLLSGLAYTGWAGLALAHSEHGFAIISRASTALAALLVLAAGYSFRRPALPETALSQLDRVADALAFGDHLPYVTPRGLASIALLFSLAVMVRVLTLRHYRGVFDPFTVLALYAVSYTLGALLGVRIRSPGMLAVVGVVVAMVHLLVAESPAGGLVEVGASVAFSGMAETSLILYVLSTAPAMLGLATLMATTALAGASVVVALLLWLGVEYEAVLLVMALAALALQYRGVTWE